MVGAVGGAVVGHDGGDFDFVAGKEVDALAEGGDGAWDFFVFEDGGETEAGVIVDGDVEGFGAGALIAIGAVTCGADARFMESA